MLAQTLTHGNDVGAIAFSPDGRLLASGGGFIGQRPKTIKLFSTPGFVETESFPAFQGAVYSLAFLPGAEFLASSGAEPADGAVKLWAVPGARLVWQRARHSPLSIAASPSGQWLAVARLDDSIEILSLPDGASVGFLGGHRADVLSLAFSPDGRHLASGSGDHSVKVWGVPSLTEEASFTGHTAAVWSVAFSPDSQLVASGTVDSSVRVWRLSDRTAFREHHQENWVWSVAFSPADPDLLASGGYAGIRLYRLSGGAEPVASVGEQATDVAFSPDGRTLVSALGDNVEATPGGIRIWNVLP